MSLGGPSVIVFAQCLEFSYTGKTANNDAKRHIAFGLFSSAGSATLQTFIGGRFGTNEYHILSFGLYRNHSLPKRENTHVLRKPDFEENKCLTF